MQVSRFFPSSKEKRKPADHFFLSFFPHKPFKNKSSTSRKVKFLKEKENMKGKKIWKWNRKEKNKTGAV